MAIRADRPDAEEARPAAVGKLFSDAMWMGGAESLGREGLAACEGKWSAPWPLFVA